MVEETRPWLLCVWCGVTQYEFMWRAMTQCDFTSTTFYLITFGNINSLSLSDLICKMGVIYSVGTVYFFNSLRFQGVKLSPLSQRNQKKVLMWYKYQTIWNLCLIVTVLNLPAVQEIRVWSLGWEDPLEKEIATHSSILAWKISWTEEPGGLQSMGSQRVGHDWATNTYLLTSSVQNSSL